MPDNIKFYTIEAIFPTQERERIDVLPSDGLRSPIVLRLNDNRASVTIVNLTPLRDSRGEN